MELPMKTKNQAEQLFIAAEMFVKRAQEMGVTTSADPMKKALDATIGKSVKDIITKALQTSISDIQVNIAFDPEAKTATFTTYTNGDEADKTLLTNSLNALSSKAYSVISKYQKTPIDYKYASYQRKA
jgi:hypothetical protein